MLKVLKKYLVIRMILKTHLTAVIVVIKVADQVVKRKIVIMRKERINQKIMISHRILRKDKVSGNECLLHRIFSTRIGI